MFLLFISTKLRMTETSRFCLQKSADEVRKSVGERQCSWQKAYRFTGIFYGSPNIVFCYRAFPFVMGPMKSPNRGHTVNGFYKKTHGYTLIYRKNAIDLILCGFFRHIRTITMSNSVGPIRTGFLNTRDIFPCAVCVQTMKGHLTVNSTI